MGLSDPHPPSPARPSDRGPSIGLLAFAFGKGLQIAQTRWSSLFLPGLLVIVLVAPLQIMDAMQPAESSFAGLGESIERLTDAQSGLTTDHRPRQRNSDVPQISPEEISQSMSSAGSSCCSSCGGFLFMLFLVMPLFAGVSVLGARLVRGDGSFADTWDGFRRYGSTCGAGCISLLVGGGIGAIVVAVSIAKSMIDLSKALADFVPSEIFMGLAAVIILATLWVNARIWFAVLRTADPSRPAIGGIQAVRWSWRATASCQLSLLVLSLFLAAVVALSMVPGSLLQPYMPGMSGRIAARLITLILAALVVLPLVLAVFGAAYEFVADLHAPRLPPVQPAVVPSPTSTNQAGKRTAR